LLSQTASPFPPPSLFFLFCEKASSLDLPFFFFFLRRVVFANPEPPRPFDAHPFSMGLFHFICHCGSALPSYSVIPQLLPISSARIYFPFCCFVTFPFGVVSLGKACFFFFCFFKFFFIRFFFFRALQWSPPSLWPPFLLSLGPALAQQHCQYRWPPGLVLR